MNKKNKVIEYFFKHGKDVLLVLLLVWIGLLYPRKIDLMGSDIGRHIKNGEVFVKEFKIISTNYYSYTNTDYTFRTHHWGAGVIYYAVWKWLGFNGLSFLNTLLILFAIYFFFRAAEKLSNFWFAMLISLAVIPLILTRREVRPENFSYLFFALSFYLMVLFNQGELRFKKLWIYIAMINILWVNIHIFFVYNLALAGSFWLWNIIQRTEYRKPYTLLLLIIVATSMASPFHVYALMEPFTIFHNFEMRILENKPVPLIENGKLFQNINFFYFKLLFAISFCSFLLVIFKRKIKEEFPYLLLFLFFSAITWLINRFTAIYGMIMIPLLARNLSIIHVEYREAYRTVMFCLVSYLILNFTLLHAFPLLKRAGMGLDNEKANEAAYFFKRNNIKGPVLNNMNNGSYLIFHLFPQEKVFYDARPEAYPARFIEEEYRAPMQNPLKWLELLNKYQFRTIFFYKRIMTEYEKNFLEERLKDPAWRLVYNDDFSMILVR